MPDLIRPRVQARAYQLWLRENCPDGRALDHWLAAERDIADEDQATDEGMATPTGPVAITDDK